MDLLKTLKKKTESKIADFKSEFMDNQTIPKIKPKFDYNAVCLTVEYGPLITEYYYDCSLDLREYLRKYNKIYPETNSHMPSFVETQYNCIIRMRDMLLSMPVVESVPVVSQGKWYKMYSQPPVKELTLEEIYYCNYLILFRYARSYQYKPEKSLNCLLKTLSWRRLRNMLRLSPDTVLPSLCKNMLYRRGFDYYASPIIYFKPIYETPVSLYLHVLGLYYTLERALQTCLLSQGNDKVYVIVDLKDWSLTRLPPADLVIETCRALVEHYTDTIDEIIFIDPPALVEPVIQMVKCVVPASTMKKLQFKPRGTKLFDYLRSRIPLCYLEKSLGGTCDPYLDQSLYWKYEESQYAFFMKKVDEWLDQNRNKYLRRRDEL